MESIPIWEEKLWSLSDECNLGFLSSVVCVPCNSFFFFFFVNTICIIFIRMCLISLLIVPTYDAVSAAWSTLGAGQVLNTDQLFRFVYTY